MSSEYYNITLLLSCNDRTLVWPLFECSWLRCIHMACVLSGETPAYTCGHCAASTAGLMSSAWASTIAPCVAVMHGHALNILYDLAMAGI